MPHDHEADELQWTDDDHYVGAKLGFVFWSTSDPEFGRLRVQFASIRPDTRRIDFTYGLQLVTRLAAEGNPLAQKALRIAILRNLASPNGAST